MEAGLVRLPAAAAAAAAEHLAQVGAGAGAAAERGDPSHSTQT